MCTWFYNKDSGECVDEDETIMNERRVIYDIDEISCERFILENIKIIKNMKTANMKALENNNQD